MGGEKAKVPMNIRLWPILYAVGCDLLFFWVVNVAFLTGVKGLSYEQFFMLDLIAAGVDILTTVPFLYLIARIGNNASLKVALFLMLSSAVLFTFGDSFALFAIANILYYKSYQFYIVYPIILENNLEKYGQKGDFIKYNARGRLAYSILSLAIASIAGYLFDLNAYIPMLACITFTVIAFIMSFFVRDETHGKYDATRVLRKTGQKLDKNMLLFTVLLLLFVILFKGCWYIGNNYAKISLQEIGVVMEVLTIVIFSARGVRVLINFFAEKILSKCGTFLSIILPILLTSGLLLLSLPLVLIEDFLTQLLLICLGIVIIFAIHDVYKLYLYDIIVKKYPKETHLKMFWLITLMDTVGILIANVVITCAVANLSVGYALLILAGLSTFCIAIGFYMLHAFRAKKPEVQEANAGEEEYL